MNKPDKEHQSAKFISSRDVYTILSWEGREELQRPWAALLWSGLVAGLCISFSLMAEAFLKHHLPRFEGAYLISNFGYCIGFTIVILGRFQLFTENTISAVLPLLDRKDLRTLWMTAKLWLIVFAANLLGTFCMASLMVYTNVLGDGLINTVSSISHHAVIRPSSDIFIQAIPAGFLVAAITWLLPNSKNSKFLVLIMMTYLIAIGDFAHVIVGSCEVFVLLLQNAISWNDGVGYIVLAASGNIIGGTCLFTVMAYAQVRQEIEDDSHSIQQKPYKAARSTNT